MNRGKIPASRAAANPVPEILIGTGAPADAAQTRSSHGEPDEMSVTNSEVESAMNHRHLKEALHAPALKEPEFNTLSTIGAYIRAVRDGLIGVARLFSKDMQVKIFKNLMDR